MKRSEMLQTQLKGPLETIQMCRDIVEGNINAVVMEVYKGKDFDVVEFQARIYTDFEILAMNQRTTAVVGPVAMGDMLTDVDCGDENDYREPSSAGR